MSCEPGRVTFRYRVNGEGATPQQSGLISLSMDEFLRRYLLHVPPPGTRVVRSYGLYAPTKPAALAVCRAQLGQGPVEAPGVLDWQTACGDRGELHPERCPTCGRPLVCRSVLLPTRRPPPEVMPEEAVA